MVAVKGADDEITVGVGFHVPNIVTVVRNVRSNVRERHLNAVVALPAGTSDDYPLTGVIVVLVGGNSHRLGPGIGAPSY